MFVYYFIFCIQNISLVTTCKSGESFHSWALVEIASGFTATIYNDMYERFKKLLLCGIRSEIAAKIAVAKKYGKNKRYVTDTDK